MIELNKKSRGFRALLWDIWEWYKSRKKAEQDKRLLIRKVQNMKEELLGLSGKSKVAFVKYCIEILPTGDNFFKEPLHATYMSYKNYNAFMKRMK
ncbi:MAG: hypothetical protein WC358_00100 [Ignavibacteria bacterium]|jgi:hypothetical protein